MLENSNLIHFYTAETNKLPRMGIDGNRTQASPDSPRAGAEGLEYECQYHEKKIKIII
jgi:hypothetical protein